jgi:ABC-type phosphate/phosphonate transport system permease subunit
MPPLTTPAAAILFMIAFFAVIMGVPLMALWISHHAHKPHLMLQYRRIHSGWRHL